MTNKCINISFYEDKDISHVLDTCEIYLSINKDVSNFSVIDKDIAIVGKSACDCEINELECEVYANISTIYTPCLTLLNREENYSFAIEKNNHVVLKKVVEQDKKIEVNSKLCKFYYEEDLTTEEVIEYNWLWDNYINILWDNNMTINIK